MVSAFGGGFDGVWLRQMDFIGGSEWCHSALVHDRILAQRSPHSSASRPPSPSGKALAPLQRSTKSAKIKRPCQKGRKDALLQKQRLARSPSKSIWKGGEAGMGRFLLKLFVLVVILALALSIKAY